jgi:hypothetical protein
VAIKNEESRETVVIFVVFFVFDLLFSMLSVSLDCSFLIATLVFYVASFSGFFILDCHFGFLVLLSRKGQIDIKGEDLSTSNIYFSHM